MDLKTGRPGDVSVMAGHSLFPATNDDGSRRRYGVNVEAGAMIATGETLQGSKVPIFGRGALRLGVNGHYDLDDKGNTSVYGAADFVSHPRQTDVQTGVTQRLNDQLALSGGVQFSSVQGRKDAVYGTTALSYQINDRWDVYTSVAANPKEQIGYAGVRFRF